MLWAYLFYYFDNYNFNCFEQLMTAVVYYVVKGVFNYFTTLYYRCCCRPFLLLEEIPCLNC